MENNINEDAEEIFLHTYRSQPFVNKADDMVRITISMTRNNFAKYNIKEKIKKVIRRRKK